MVASDDTNLVSRTMDWAVIEGGLYDQAVRFRRALEAYSAEGVHSMATPFPRGWCKLSSIFFARHLYESGGPISRLVANARRATDPAFPLGTVHELWAVQSHAWLRVGDLDVDLTADQFSDEARPIICAIDDPFFKTFSGAREHDLRPPLFFSRDNWVEMYAGVSRVLLREGRPA